MFIYKCVTFFALNKIELNYLRKYVYIFFKFLKLTIYNFYIYNRDYYVYYIIDYIDYAV